MSPFISFANDRILMDFNTPNLLLFDIYHASYCGKSTKQCVLLEISIWIFHVLTWRSYLPQETARVWASGSRGSHTSGSPTQRSDMMIFVIVFFFTVHAAFDPSALLCLPFCWLSSSDPAGGGEGTSAGLWAAGQRLSAEPAAVCRDICTEQTRGMKRDRDFKAFLIRFNLRLFFLPELCRLYYDLFLFLSALNVCWIYSYRVLPSGDRGSPAQLTIHSLQTHSFNISNCQTKPLLSILCSLVVKDNFLLHQCFWPPLLEFSH